MSFATKRIRNVDFSFSSADISVFKEGWKSFCNQPIRYPNRFKGKGIVYTAGGISYLTCAYVSISLLRQLGCKLPVEIWHRGNEVSVEGMRRFSHLDVKFKNFFDFEKSIPSGYILKPLAIVHSEFEEVLFLDTDNNCVKDPEYLFYSGSYKEYGAVFWPDYWFTSRKNSIWEITGSKAFQLPEQESGQILINKKQCWRELNLSLYFNKLGEYYYKLLLGDKDTFKFAWLALQKPFFMIPKGVGSCGYLDDDRFYGHTMVQHDENNQILFLHRNLLKWDITLSNEFSWDIIKEFSDNSDRGSVNLQPTPKGHLAIDLIGSTITSLFHDKFPNLERDCINYLSDWREHPFYKEFLQYSHFAKNRYADGKLFNKYC
jgi:alpha 1,2-mannosyltransferase